MQVSVETEGLKRVVRVDLPTEAFEAEVDKRLRDYSRSARIDGFRPGKVPISLLRQRFGGEIRVEVLKEMANETLPVALEQENLRPVVPTEVDFDMNINNQDRVYGYTVNFEVAPKIELIALNEYTIKRPVPTLTDDDIEAVIDNIRKKYSTWVQVERAITHGDQVMIDAAITVGDQSSHQDQVELIIGQESMKVPGFDDQLLNAQPGASLNFDLTLPEDYPVTEMANQQAHFEVKIHAVNERHIPTLDELLPIVEIDSIDELREGVRLNTEKKLSQLIADQMKQAMLDILISNSDFEVPKALLKHEKQMIQQTFGDFASVVQGMEEFNEQITLHASHQAKRWLLMQEVISHYDLTTNDKEVKDFVLEMSFNYQEPQAFIKHVYNNHRHIENIQSQLLEQKAIAHLLEQIQVEEISATVDDITNPDTLQALVSGEQPTS